MISNVRAMLAVFGLLVFSVSAPVSAATVQDVVSSYIAKVTETAQSSMKDQDSVGNGKMMVVLDRLTNDYVEALDQFDVKADASDLDMMRVAATTMTGGEPVRISSVNFKAAIDRANERLKNAGIDFLLIEQDANAAIDENLIRKFNDYLSGKITHKEYATVRGALVVGGQPETLIAPTTSSRLVGKANEKLVREGQSLSVIQFVSSPLSTLTPIDQPTPKDAKKYGNYLKIRNVIMPPAAALSTVSGAAFSVPGIVTGAWVYFLEWQFIKFTNKWANFWSKYKFPGNVAVNVGYGVSAMSLMTLAQYVLGDKITTDPKEFLVKSVVLGAGVFIATFGTGQIKTAELRDLGEISETKRSIFEFWSVIVNAVGGRALAIGAATLAGTNPLFQLFGLNFGAVEIVGWSVMGTYGLLVSLPLAIKMKWGDLALDTSIRERLSGIVQPGAKGLCQKFLAGIARRYTMSR